MCEDCNVLLVSMDTVRADHLSCYGYERKTTPNVDKVARHGVLFETAVSQSAWTLPAHGSMMTGLYPGRLGVAHYPAKRRIPNNVPMLAEQFKRAGYATGGFTGGGFVSAHFGFDRGFDIYSSDGRRFEHNLDEALLWLENVKDRRFFMFFHGYNAHRPYFSGTPDKAAMELASGAPIEKRGFCLKGRREKPPKAQLDQIIKYYDASIHHGDRYLGKLLRRLDAIGIAEKTIVLITSDHGDEFFEHGNCDHVRFLYQEVINVPYILRVPGYDKQPRRVREVIPASISVPRTLLDLVGIEHNMPGVSVVPILQGKSGLFDAVYSESQSVAGALGSRGDTIAMTTARHKLISYTEEGTDEAYDRQRDPAELKVLPETHNAYQARASLRAWHDSLVPLPKTGRSAPGDAKKGDDGKSKPADEIPSEIEDQLKALGYME